MPHSLISYMEMGGLFPLHYLPRRKDLDDLFQLLKS
jgi:hypothetical protein